MFILTHLALSSASSLGLGGAFLFSNSRCHQRLVVVLPPSPSGFQPPYRSTGHAFARNLPWPLRKPHPEIEIRDMLSYQLCRAGAGTPSSEKPGVLVQRMARRILAPPRPQRWIPAPRIGKSSTALHFLIRHGPSVYNSRIRRWRAGIEVDWRAIPDRSAGHAFVPIAHAGWRRHTEV